jgi:hypothetical protein
VAVLERAEFLHKRGEDGKLLPEKVTLEDNSGDVLMTPLTLGELNELAQYGKTGKDFDIKDAKQAEIIAKHLVEPSFTKEELLGEGFKALKYAQLAKALLKVSGMDDKKKE